MTADRIPYADQITEMAWPGRTFVFCPACQRKIVLTERKDFESYTGSEYATHYRREHADLPSVR